MAAARLSPLSALRLPADLPRAWLTAYAAIWAQTLSVALLVALAGQPLTGTTQHVLGLTLTAQDNPPPGLGHILALAAHNVPIVAWPLLLGVVGFHRRRLAVHIADAAVLACMIANTAPVGAALGAYGGPLLSYIPQLPLEWAGFALGVSAWLVQRRRRISPCERLLWLALIACALVGAAALEGFAVPHREMMMRG